MKYVDRFLQHVRRAGQSAVYHHETGDACPCVNSDTGYCDQEWHRNNPTADDCNGTGLINVAVTDTDVKAFILPKSAVGELDRIKIGLMDNADFLFMGAFKTADGSLFDVSAFNEAFNYVLFQSNKYILRNIDTERIGDEIVYYYALMQRRAD